MSEKRFAGKVGVFVVAALAVAIALFFIFAKGASLFTPTYELNGKAQTVAGLRKGAAVTLSGIVVGTVLAADVAPGGRGVLIRLNIKSKYKIHSDARFAIEQIGFLGDQYVAIYPQENKGEILAPGSIVPLEEPFNIQEIARSARDLIDQFDEAAKTLNTSIERVGASVLSDQNLTNVSRMLANFHAMSEKAVVTMDTIHLVVQSNSAPITFAVSNLVQFSDDLDKLADGLREMLATNRYELTLAVKNLQTASKGLEVIAKDVEDGKGLAGALLRDSGLQTNVTNLVANLTTLSSNLTKYGLLYKPKRPNPEGPQPKAYTGRNPINP